MNESEPCEVVIRYKHREMPPTSLFFLKQDIERICGQFTPKLTVRLEQVET